MARFVPALFAAFALIGAAHAECRETASGAARYAVCEFDPSTDDIQLFLNDGADTPYMEFDALRAALEARGETLVFAMNAGMYDAARAPVGLYVEGGKEIAPLNTNDGPGNFHLKPNGVFRIDGAGAHVETAEQFLAMRDSPLPLGEGLGVRVPASRLRANVGDGTLTPGPSPTGRGEKTSSPLLFATQSGPMLVIEGAIHPRFLADSTSKKRRNGVGVRADGTVVFAIADAPVSFHEFATFFRDALKTPNALYLDGGTGTSRLYAPELSRNDDGDPMGPIVAVVSSSERQTP